MGGRPHRVRTAGVVRLDVELSFLLFALKGPIEQQINKELDALFGKA
jgi:hypothetical protein